MLVCFGFFSYNYFSETINANQQMCRTPYQVGGCLGQLCDLTLQKCGEIGNCCL